jgi:hypothetical protein
VPLADNGAANGAGQTVMVGYGNSRHTPLLGEGDEFLDAE